MAAKNRYKEKYKKYRAQVKHLQEKTALFEEALKEFEVLHDLQKEKIRSLELELASRAQKICSSLPNCEAPTKTSILRTERAQISNQKTETPISGNLVNSSLLVESSQGEEPKTPPLPILYDIV